MNGQRVKHIIDNKERIANYSKREELLHWEGTYVKMIDFAKLHYSMLIISNSFAHCSYSSDCQNNYFHYITRF